MAGKELTAAERKQHPVASGVLDYFPDALLEIALVSWTGNEQHNPGEPLHWAKEKSTDEADALVRHLMARGKRDTDGMRHTAKVAWRALALLQREIEGEQKDIVYQKIKPGTIIDVTEDEMKSLRNGVTIEKILAARTNVSPPVIPNSTPHSTKSLTEAESAEIQHGIRLTQLAEELLAKPAPANLETDKSSKDLSEESARNNLLSFGCGCEF